MNKLTFKTLIRRVRRKPGCWLWQGKVHVKGYPCISGGQERAHRVAWKLWHGPLHRNQRVLRSCRNDMCVNPKHLYLQSGQPCKQERTITPYQKGIQQRAKAIRDWPAL